MKVNKTLFASLVGLALFLIFNLQWTMQDYGLKSISLSKQVLAQDSTTNLVDKIIGGVTKLWEDAHQYAEYKAHKGTEREVTKTIEGTTGVSIGRPGASGTTGVKNSITIKQIEYLYICVGGKDRIFCSESWLNSPHYVNVE